MRVSLKAAEKIHYVSFFTGLFSGEEFLFSCGFKAPYMFIYIICGVPDLTILRFSNSSKTKRGISLFGALPNPNIVTAVTYNTCLSSNILIER